SEIHLDYLQRSKRRGCEIVGTDGTLVWTSEGKEPERCLVRFGRPGNQSWETILDEPNLDTAAPYVELMQRFLAGKNDERDLLYCREAAGSLAVALAAKRAAATHCAVRPEPIG